MLQRFVVGLTLFIVLNLGLQAQSLVEREWLAIHPRAGVGYTSHSSTIVSFEGVQDCGLFDHGSQVSPEFSLSLETPVLHSLYVGLGVRYTDRSVSLYAQNTSLPAADVTKPGGVVTVLFENSINTTLHYLDLIPELRYEISQIGRSHQRLGIGFIAGFASSATYDQQQRIVSPENVVYTMNNRQTVSISNGTHDISDINKPLIGLSLSVENLLPVGSSSFFTQQVTIEKTLNDVVASAPWKTLAIRGDIGFRFSLRSAEQVQAPPPPPPPPVEKPAVTQTFQPPPPLPILTAHIENVNAYLQTGHELKASTALVNAVFFDHNSAEIPLRYYRHGQLIEETDDAVEYHRQILASIAGIVSANPNSSVVLEGATSGSDETGIDLATQRADAVRQALIAYGIDAKRISTKAAVSPRNPSNAEYAQGREENRRVDIQLVNAPLQEYVAREQFVQLKGEATISIEAMNFKNGEIIVQSPAFKEQVFEQSGSRKVELNQRLSSDSGRYSLEIASHAAPSLNSNDHQDIDLQSLRREQIVLNLQSFDAILRFDYNSSEFSQANKDLLRQLVSKLPAGSTIQVLGSADAIGDEASNRQLSERRAASTENFIRSVGNNSFKIVSSVSTDKFNESRPEGRFLNRCIRIRVSE